MVSYENVDKKVLLERYEGAFSEGFKKGVGTLIRIKDYFEKTYEEFVGDFYNDKPLYSSGIQKPIEINN